MTVSLQNLHTVNNRLSALGAYLKTKDFIWVPVRTGCLVGPGHLAKDKKN